MKILWALKAVWVGSQDRHHHPAVLWWCEQRSWKGWSSGSSGPKRGLYDDAPLTLLRSAVSTSLHPSYVVRLVRIKRRPKARVVERDVIRGVALKGGSTGYALMVRPHVARPQINSDSRMSSDRDFTGNAFMVWLNRNIGAEVRVTLERLEPAADAPELGHADPPEIP